MKRLNFQSLGGSLLLFLFALHASAFGQGITSINTLPAGGNSNLINLTSVTVDRPSGTQTIPVGDLIGIDILGYDNAIETIPFEGRRPAKSFCQQLNSITWFPLNVVSGGSEGDFGIGLEAMDGECGVVDSRHDRREPWSTGVVAVLVPPTVLGEMQAVFDPPMLAGMT